MGACFVFVGAMAGCGPAPPSATANISIPFPLTKAQCPALPATPAVQARLIIEGMDKACSLSLQAQANGDFATRGECQHVPTGASRTLTLQWFVTAPNATPAKDIILAESVGRADIIKPDSQIVEVVFDASVPSLRPKTKALPTETSAEKDRFNCDRTGTNVCDVNMQPTAGSGADADSCSNLEELCRNTLFLSQNDNCTN
ncbi:MAG: hypothetical protein IT381_09210 [Deltaproteobacteria bacterium]|nr:hypothetical protein [Deltaproteobacteria bacterium]